MKTPLQQLAKGDKNRRLMLFGIGVLVIVAYLILKRRQTPQVVGEQAQAASGELGALGALTGSLQQEFQRQTQQGAALSQLFQEGEERLAALVTGGVTGLAQGVNTKIDTLGTAVNTGFTGQRTYLEGAFTALQTAITNAFTTQNTSLTTLGTNITTAVNTALAGLNTSLDTKFATADTTIRTLFTETKDLIRTLPNKDSFYLQLGAQSPASCFGSGVGSLPCYNVKAPISGLRWVGDNEYGNAEVFVQQKYGQYRKPDGSYDLVQVGKALAQERGLIQ